MCMHTSVELFQLLYAVMPVSRLIHPVTLEYIMSNEVRNIGSDRSIQALLCLNGESFPQKLPSAMAHKVLEARAKTGVAWWYPIVSSVSEWLTTVGEAAESLSCIFSSRSSDP